MRVIFLGTGTSHGVPMIGCRCAVCRSDDPRDRRWRPSIYIEADNGGGLLVDTGPDLRSQALQFGISRVDAILFTHGHADHVVGLDEVRRFNAIQRAAIPCYGDAQTLGEIRKMFSYVFDPDAPRGGGVPDLMLREITGPFQPDGVGPMEVTPVPVLHGRRPVLGFRIGGFAYLTDCSGIPDGSWELLRDLDVLVLDALRERPHPTHFSLGEAVDASTRIGARQTLFTHICHDLPHEATCERLPDGMALAYDGQILRLNH